MSFSLGDYIEHVGWGRLELPNVGAPTIEIATNPLSGSDRVRHVEYRHGKLYLEPDCITDSEVWTNTVVTQVSPTELHLRINKMRFEEHDYRKVGGGLREMKCYSYIIKCTDEVVEIYGQTIDTSDLAEYVSCRLDCHKNPISKPIWHLLEPADPPQYDGNRIFITDDQRIYIAIVERQWLEVQSVWMERNKRSIPSAIFDELDAFTNISKASSIDGEVNPKDIDFGLPGLPSIS